MQRILADEFQTLVKTIITPLLKELGFKKKNLNFNRTINDLIQSVNIQKSQYNHNECCLFTINLGFYNCRIFQLSKNVSEEPKFITSEKCFVWTRSGQLIYNHDYWYELNQNKTYLDVSQQVENDFKNHLIPMFLRLQSLSPLLKLLRMESETRPFSLVAASDDICLAELEFGDWERGRNSLQENYNKAMIPKSTQHTTVYPDGRREVKWSEPSVNDFHISKLIRIAKNYKIAL